MDDNEEVKRPARHEVGMVLDALSVDELEERIALLEGEIARLRAAISNKSASRDDAERFFKA